MAKNVVAKHDEERGPLWTDDEDDMDLTDKIEEPAQPTKAPKTNPKRRHRREAFDHGHC